MNKKSIKFQEKQIIDHMVSEIERITEMKCKVVPQSDTWYDGFTLDTSALALDLFLLGGFEEHLQWVKKKVEEHKNAGNSHTRIVVKDRKTGLEKKTDYTTITLINNGINRNLMRVGAEVPVEDVTPDYYLQK